MHIPEQLFALPLLKDVKTQPIEYVFRRGPNTVAALSIFFSGVMYTVPQDRFFCLTSYAAAMTPDAIGGTPTSLSVYGVIDTFVGAQPIAGMLVLGATLAAGQPTQTFGQATSIWLPPGTQISMQGTFNTTATHGFLPTLSGITFPRGSVSIG